MAEKNHNIIDIQKYFLLGMLLLLIVVLLMFVSPFITTLMIAAVLVTAVYPVHRLFSQKIHIPKSISALLSLIIVAAVILAPFTALFFFVANQATDAYASISDKINVLTTTKINLLPAILQKGFLEKWVENISKYAPISTNDIVQTAKDFVGTISTFLLSHATGVLKNLSMILIHVIVFLMALYYLLRDGADFAKKINSLMPMSEVYRKELFKKMSNLSYSIIYGLFGAAIAQGATLGLAFAIVGISNAAFWGSVAALLSPVPYIGTAIVWGPAVIALAVGKHWIAATFLLAWGLGVVSTVDNIVKPYLIGSSAALHPLAVLVVLLGGMFAFGLKGLLFGPFILTLTLAFLHIYEMEYKKVLDGKKK